MSETDVDRARELAALMDRIQSDPDGKLDRILEELAAVRAELAAERARRRPEAPPLLTIPIGGKRYTEDELTPEIIRLARRERLEYTERNGGLMSESARAELAAMRAEVDGEPLCIHCGEPKGHANHVVTSIARGGHLFAVEEGRR